MVVSVSAVTLVSAWWLRIVVHCCYLVSQESTLLYITSAGKKSKVKTQSMMFTEVESSLHHHKVESWTIIGCGPSV